MALTTTQIKKALRERGLVYREVALLADPPLDVSTVGANVQKVPGKRSSRARAAIAQALGLTVEEVFGDAEPAKVA